MTHATPSSIARFGHPVLATRHRLALLLTVLSAVFAFVASAQAATPSLYVTNSFGFSHPARLTRYAAGVTGNAAPLTNLVGAATGVNGAVGVARDPEGLVWVSNTFDPPSVTAYAAAATGNTAPVATISGAATGLKGPAGIAFDASGCLVVANTYGSITEYAPGARGDASPVVTISGADTGLSNPNGVAFDAVGDLYVTNEGNASVTEYAPGASGDASPIATLQGGATGFAPSVAPVATIAGGATGLSAPQAVAVVPPLSILSKHLPGGIVGHLYHATLRAALGTTPYRWSLAQGRLPAGLNLSRQGGLSGVPHRPARRWLTIAVADAGHPRMTARRRVLLTTARWSGAAAPAVALTRYIARICHSTSDARERDSDLTSPGNGRARMLNRSRPQRRCDRSPG